MGASFTHLHQHTEFSMLDGAARIPDVIARAVADGQPAIGITDHGNMYGVLDFYKAANKAGIKPIIGTEAYMAGESRFERPVRRGRVDDTGGDAEAGEKLYYHLTLLAETTQGYRNLLKLSSEAYLSGYFYKPRCLLPGQEIVTPEGVKAIEEIEVGDLVMTHQGRFRPVTRTMSRQHSGDIYGLRLSGRYSRTTWMTGEHPVLVRERDGERRWVEARDIRPGRPGAYEAADQWHSWVCLPRPVGERTIESIETAELVDWDPVAGRPGWWTKVAPRRRIGPTAHYGQLLERIPLTEEFGFVLGLYVAEGGINRGEVTWSFHEDEQDLVDRVSAMVEKLTGKRPTVAGRPDRPGYRGVSVRASSTLLAQLLERLCGKGASNKHLPVWVHDAPFEFQIGLAEGVLAGDGAVRENVTVLCQTSRNLAWQMRSLLCRLADDFSCVRTSAPKSAAHAPQYTINCSPQRPLHHRKTLSDDRYVYKPVAAVETRHYDGPVYNIEVADDHSYVSDFAIHNCDWDLLGQHHEGIIATTGCLGGVVLQSLLRDDFERATAQAARLQDIFGRDSLFVELQDHGLPEQRRTNPELIRLARRIGAPLLATNDSHYVARSDAEAHDALLCVQTGSVKDDPKRFKFHGDEHYLKTAAEMRDLFRDFPEACDNTLWIAERAEVEIEFGKPKLPSFPRPAGFDDADSYLRHLALEGARERYGDPLPAAAAERIEYELGVISDMGFSDYFLVVWDLIRHARESGIRVGPGRGSAAGCCVAYCLRIVDLDPIRYNLLFERFLNPGRKQMPDIDMDFDERYRSEMIRYAAERWGWDRVAQIVTFSTIKARAAVRDASRVLGYPYGLGDKIAKLMPPLVMGRDTPLWACLEEHPKYADGFKQAADLRTLCATDPDAAKVVEVARGLEGMRRQDGIHAAAVVISGDALTEHLPIQRKPEPGGRPEDAPIVTQYEMHGVEELGLLKMDFLGLRNLSVIERALDLIEEATGERPDIDGVPLDDPKVFAMLQKADTIGIFQLEGGPMRNLVRSLAPTEFEDVAALVALYRPGPMAANMHNDYADRKNGRKPITYQHADMEAVLGDTYGLCLTGDTVVHDARTGRPVRLDQVDPASGILVQGVDVDLTPAVRPVTHWVCNGERETLRLTLGNGMCITGTADHPVLTESGWKRLGDLTADDYVATARELVALEPGREVDADRLRILGYLIGDGGLTVRSSVLFTNTDAGVLDGYRRAVERAFPTVRLSERTTSAGVTHILAGNGRGHGGGPSPLLQWLRELGLKSPAGSGRGGAGSADKYIPEFVFGLPDDQISLFIAAMWDCDGYVGRRMAHYRTISERLAGDLQRLLLRIGVESSIYRHSYVRPGSGETVWAHQVTVYDGERFGSSIRPHLGCARKAAVDMAVASRGTTLSRRMVLDAVTRAHRTRPRGSLRSVCAEAGVSRSHLGEARVALAPRISEGAAYRLAEAFDATGVDFWLGCNWERVASVEPAGRQVVYDITVEGIHNFIGNGIVVHNCIYQEQVMLLAQKFAGYSLAEADNLRKAAGKKIREVMAKEREKFESGCEATGYGRAVGKMLFDIIEPFADYGFNRSHAFGYGFVSYQTAWLKAHYPAQYLAALLTSVKDDKDKTAVYLAECRGQGIEVLVPDVNVSASDFTAAEIDDEQGKTRWVIPFGLSAIRNVGEALVEKVIAEREAAGPFTDFYDFCARVDPMVLNKRTVESLIKGGAFDSLGHPRQGLCLVFDQIVDRTLARRREADQGVMSLFGDLGGGEAVFDDARVPIPDQDFDKSSRLAFEKEMLGLYLSDHPLKGVEAALARHTDTTIAELRDLAAAGGGGGDGSGRGRDGDARWVGGVVTALVRKYTKRGDLMATFVLEDLDSSIEVWVFPKTMTEVGWLLSDDAVVCVRGRLDLREDTPKLICMEVKKPELTEGGAEPLHLHLPLHALTDDRVDSLKRLLTEHPGDSPVFLHVGAKCIKLAPQFCVDTSRGLLAELRELLGQGCLGAV